MTTEDRPEARAKALLAELPQTNVNKILEGLVWEIVSSAFEDQEKGVETVAASIRGYCLGLLEGMDMTREQAWIVCRALNALMTKADVPLEKTEAGMAKLGAEIGRLIKNAEAEDAASA